MDISERHSDEAVLEELGQRIAQHRLNRNITQAALARDAGVSLRTLHRIEHGQGTQVGHLIRVLRVLGLLGNIDALVPAPPASPIQALKLRGKRPQRASRGGKPAAPKAPWSWVKPQ